MQLYGGAIKVSLSDDFIDASTIRQVPDYQEIYLHKQKDQSIIFEILEYQNDNLYQCIREHYKIVYGCDPIKQYSEIVEGRNGDKNVFMGIKRFEEYKSDILVTFNGNGISLVEFTNLLNSVTVVDSRLFIN
jgi:hypothetical protein